MAKGNKKHGGADQKTTVLQLQPAKYQISLLYLGHDRIRRDDATYRCKYELQRGQATITNKPDLIANCVPGTDDSEAARKAASPAEKGGDYTNPPRDQMYRLVFTDNHGLRSKESNLLGRPAGDNESKPTNYAKVDGAEKRDWLPDISPAVPFRVVVRKFFGGTPVDLNEGHQVVFEVKDPVEEFEADDTARRKFLKKFFAKYNREGRDPDPGDDNAITDFSGVRPSPQPNPGVKATDVLRKVAYVDPPKIDRAPAGTNHVQFSQLAAATAHGTSDAKFELTLVEEGEADRKVKVGIADLAFLPKPVLGDNYRFLVSLLSAGGKDIREEEENGVPPLLLDHSRAELPAPRCYTTGRIVLWKRMRIRLVVLCNRTQRSDITWGDAVAAYRRAFIELVPPDDPAGYYNLVPAQWIAELKTQFPSQAANLEAIMTAAPPNDLETVYRQFFYPKCLTDNFPNEPNPPGQPVGLHREIVPLVRRIITHACTNVIPALESPDSENGKKQLDPDGFYICLVRRLTPTSSLLGSSFGDRMFWFTNPGGAAGVASTTNTFAHEMGHAQYLRHSHTAGVVGGGGGGGESATWTSAPAVPPAGGLWLYDGTSNNQIKDHDQDDAFNCYMAYTAPDAPLPTPCGLCALTLRFYDRVRVQANNQYQNQTMAGLSALTIVRGRFAQGGNPVWTLDEPAVVGGVAKLPDLSIAAAAPYYVLAVSKPIQFQHYQGPAQRLARVNVSTVGGGQWASATVSGGGTVTRAVVAGTVIQLTGTHTGRVRLTFALSGMNASAELDVVP
jgi:hypothetical protein